jgi:hypothetical protein
MLLQLSGVCISTLSLSLAPSLAPSRELVGHVEDVLVGQEPATAVEGTVEGTGRVSRMCGVHSMHCAFHAQRRVGGKNRKIDRGRTC